MSWLDALKPKAAKVREGVCPKCGEKLLDFKSPKGCWIPMHFRCPKCRCCWRDDGTGRGCRVGGER